MGFRDKDANAIVTRERARPRKFVRDCGASLGQNSFEELLLVRLPVKTLLEIRNDVKRLKSVKKSFEKSHVGLKCRQ